MSGGTAGLTSRSQRIHTKHMKRTTLMLDEHLLIEAKRVAAGATISSTVNRALEDFVKRARARRILELAGTGAWDGNLGEMRRDEASPRKGRR
jgi:Arc/MetJ family transcription regulator